MLRFLSKKRTRNEPKSCNFAKPNIQSYALNKYLIQCKVILLDGTDLSVDLSVSNPLMNYHFVPYILY